MIAKKTFLEIRQHYGDIASWALWDDIDIRDIEILGPNNFDAIQSILKPEIVLVGLNVSADIPPYSFANFHETKTDSSKRYLVRLCEVLKETPIWGAYITDIIKYKNKCKEKFIDSNSRDVGKALKDDDDLVRYNLRIFHEELKTLNVENKVLIAFGGKASEYLERYRDEFVDKSLRLEKISHYSYRFKRFKGYPYPTEYEEYAKLEIAKLRL